MRDIPEIRLGSILFSIVDAKEGGEKVFNRWYERDHFFAGCMIGANFFSARRWIATRDLKQKRFPATTPVTPDITKGSFLHTYWILDPYYEETLRWSVDQVLQLHKQKRMEPARDNISTAFYKYRWGVFRDEDGVPPELALEHPYKGVLATLYDRDPGVSQEAFEAWLKGELARLQAGSPVAQSLAFQPEQLPDDAPKYVARVPEDILQRRWLVLSFLEANPREWWDARIPGLEQGAAASGMAQLIYGAAFIPTVPGKDTYLDEL
jgi:hypothetical protein